MAINRINTSDITDKVNVAIIEAFTELGHKAALAAYRDARYNGRTYKDRSYNLHDSYGSAVYVNGALVENSIRYVNEGVSKTIDSRAPSGFETGIQALRTYFQTAFVVRKRDSYTILVASAMWYASMLEKKGYTVISYEASKKYIARNLDSVMLPILRKYKIESVMPTLRKGMGVDSEYFRFGGSRHR